MRAHAAVLALTTGLAVAAGSCTSASTSTTGSVGAATGAPVLPQATDTATPPMPTPTPSAAVARASRFANGSGGANQPAHLAAPYVVLWSFDGFRASYLDAFETPNFDQFARGGARSEGMLPAFPTMTFPTHYSVATGLYPENHGLVANVFYDPTRDEVYTYRERSNVEDGSWYRGEPIWVTAEKQGMVSAAYFYVGTEADIQGVRPTIWKPFDNSVPNEQRVDSVLAWLDLPEERRPHMLTLYVSDVDGAGHRFGPQAPETAAAVARADSLLGRFMEGLAASPIRDQVYVVLMADHGMAEVDSERVEYLDDFIDASLVRQSALGAYANLFVQAGGNASDLKDQIEAGLQHGRAFLKADVPPELHFSTGDRVGDIVILMEEGWRVYADRANPPSPGTGGQHGYVPFLRSMHALFMAWGPSVTPGTVIPLFESVNVYPWMAGVLGLEPAANLDGDATLLRDALSGR